MELTPQLLTDEIDFRIAVRGYDRNEVDDFLERVAVAVGQLQSQLGKAVARAKAAEKRLAELDAPGSPGTRLPSREQPAVVVPPAEPEPAPEAKADAAVAVTPPPAAPVKISSDEDLNEELRRTLVLAQRTADSAIREAREEAETIVEGARADARRAVVEAEAESARTRDEARRRLIDEIAELESVREAMRNDTVVLERYLGDERAKVRETIQVLRRLVDEPRSLQVAPVPELSEASTPVDTPALGVGTPEPEPEPAPAPEPAAEPESAPEDAAPTPAPPASTPVVTIPEPTAEPESEPEPEAKSDAAPEATPEPEASSQATAPEAAADPQPSSSTQDEGQALGRLFDAGEAPRDWRSGGAERGDQGPHTQPVAAARFEEETDDAFLAELRRAMADNEPLGPDDAGRSR
jgi:DivIVA domain-containing protein